MSRSLVGSSRSSTLGSASSSRSSWKRRRSPPDRSPTRVAGRSPVKPNRSSSEPALTSPSPSRVDLADVLDRLEHPRVGDRRARELLGEVPSRPSARACAGPASARASPASSAQHRRLAGAVDADDADPVARAEPPGARVQQLAARPRDQVDVLEVDHVLAEPLGGEPLQLDRSRGGGSSSISALAASMRNFGLRGPRRRPAAQPGQLLAQQVLPALLGGGRLPLALGLGQHERRVAAVVGVDRRRRAPPRSVVADRVEEPAVVGDDDERRPLRVRGPGGRPARPPPRRRGGWWARRGRSRSWSPRSSAASEQRRRSPPESPTHARSEARCRRAAPRRPRGCAASAAQTWSGSAAEHRLADRVGVVEGVALRQEPTCSPPTLRDPAGRRAPPAGITSQQGGLAVAVAADDADALAARRRRARRRRAEGARRRPWDARSRLTRLATAQYPRRARSRAPATGPWPGDQHAPASRPRRRRRSAASSGVGRRRRGTRRSAPSRRPSRAARRRLAASTISRARSAAGRARPARGRCAARRPARRRRQPRARRAGRPGSPARARRRRGGAGRSRVDRAAWTARVAEGTTTHQQRAAGRRPASTLAVAGAEGGAAEQRERDVAAEAARRARAGPRREVAGPTAGPARAGPRRRRPSRRPARRRPGSPCAICDGHPRVEAVVRGEQARGPHRDVGRRRRARAVRRHVGRSTRDAPLVRPAATVTSSYRPMAW